METDLRKDMEIDLKTWKRMEGHGNGWKDMEIDGKTWKLI